MGHEAEVAPGDRWKRLGDMLLNAGLITSGQLAEGLAEKDNMKCFLGQALVKLGYITQDELISFLVKQCKIPHINLVDYRIDPRIVRLLPADLCLQYKLIAIDQMGSILTVGMVNPLDIDALEHARSVCPDLKLKPILCTPEHFEAAARTHLVTEEAAAAREKPAELTLSSFGLSASAAAPAKPAPKPTPSPGAGTIPGERVRSDENFSRLVRDVLAELLNCFQGPLQGKPASDESLWTSNHGSDAQFSFTVELGGSLCYASPTVTNVLGYAPEEFQTRFLDLLTNNPGNAMLRQALTLSLTGRQRPPVEAEFTALNGDRHTLVIALIPVYDGNEQLVAVQGIARDMTRRAEAEVSLYYAATQDPLTGLYNQRSFLSRLEETLLLTNRHKTPVSIAVVNVDNFTNVNEVYGNDEGDAVLRQVGQILRRTLRGEDIVARSGGDEFCILMPNVAPENGQHGIGRYKDALTKAQFIAGSGQSFALTVTAGFAGIRDGAGSPEEVLESARALVRRGKASGGDRVVLDGQAAG